MNIQAQVISLRRTPKRLAWFRHTNARQADHITLVDGIDGPELLSVLKNSRLVGSSAFRHWTAGAIGSALSHLRSWRHCLKQGKPTLVLEDDVVLAVDWQHRLNTLCTSLDEDWDLVLLGWNYNSVLHSQNKSGIETIRLFEPAFPDLDQIRTILQPNRLQQLERLKHAFGLPAYLINPAGAERLLALVPPLQLAPLTIARGIPAIETTTLDGLLNLHYPQLQAWVVNPPLAVALNDPGSSLTQTEPQIIQFGN
jgi:GR25 family glycosyltransferase involved in LPS biosynthesis